MRLVKWLVGIVVVFGLIVGLAPILVKWYVINELHGKGYQAEIKKLGIDFIFGEIHFSGVELKSPQNQKLNVFEAEFDFNLLAFKDKAWTLEKITFDDMSVDLDTSDKGLLVAGLPVMDWLPGKASSWPLRIQTVQINNSEICRAQYKQCLHVDTLTVSRLNWEVTENGLEVRHDSPFYLSKGYLRDQSEELSIFYIEELNVERSSLAPASLKIGNVLLRNFHVVENAQPNGIDAPYQTQLGELTIQNIDIARGEKPAVKIGDMSVIGLRQSLHKNSANEFILPTRLKLWFPELVNLSRDGITVDGNPSTIELNHLKIDSGTASWLDHSVNPPAIEKLTQLMLEFGPVNSVQPELASDLKISAKVGTEGELKLQGKVYPHHPDLKFDLEGFIRNVSVKTISAYSKMLLHQRVEEGMVDASMVMSINANKVDGETNWRFTQFKVEPARRNTGSMPLELSLDILQDRNQSVEILVPVKGVLRGKDTLTEMVGSRLRKTIDSMARGQVNPTGAASIAPRSSIEDKAKVSFRPLLYSANSRTPGQVDLQRLKEISDLLLENKAMTLVFCPVSTGGEWSEMFNLGKRPSADAKLSDSQRQTLTELAVARGSTLKATLMDLGVRSSQVVICGPAVDMTQFGPSYISVSL